MTPDTLQNEFLRLAVKRTGAELTSIADARGVEYLWQGDPLVWEGQSPVLFPIVGRLAGDSYTHAGRRYGLPQHGFARRKPFTLAERGDGLLRYTLEPDAETRAAYPFAFHLELSYRLLGRSVSVAYAVRNPGAEPLPFSIGGHPAFSCSRHPGDVLEDYSLEFEHAETADAPLIRDGLIAAGETRRILTNQKILPLTNTLFDRNALVFSGLASRAITLRSRRHPAGVRVDFPSFPALGIWSKPAAPYVCIEPWFGYADPVGREPGSPLATKPGIVLLAPGDTFTCAWQATIVDGPADPVALTNPGRTPRIPTIMKQSLPETIPSQIADNPDTTELADVPIRRHVRVDARLDVLFALTGETPRRVVRAVTRDISHGGACLEVADCPAGLLDRLANLPLLDLEIDLSADAAREGLDAPAALRGQVEWVRPIAATHGAILLGLEFRDASPADEMAIIDLIAHLLLDDGV
jgi:galactose mutarotase-like enzyme